ncbi:MAG: alpha/beta hydrolase [Alphaproteobacteria bacterium]|nr:alpha/beta hydrolase [Alphaproteobacteria bacterium]
MGIELIVDATLWLAAAWGGGVAGLFTFQRRLVFRPFGRPGPPARAGLPELVAVEVTAADGVSSLAWWAPPPSPGRPTIVLFHGNAGHLGHRAGKARVFLDAGMGVLLASYRGFAGSPGKPTEQGLYADGRAALDWLEARGVPASNVVLHGESLGSGVAVQMATERRVAAVVLEAPFTSVPDVGARRYPIVPVRLLARDRFDNLAKIGAIGAPLLIVHGTSDRIVPIAMGRRLLAAAAQPKEMIEIAGGRHCDCFEGDRISRILSFAETWGTRPLPAVDRPPILPR